MSRIMEDVTYLSQEIGPRPAGTEEEQQAALYIADQLQKRTGFSATIEDFAALVQPGIVEAICFGVPALFSLLAIILNVLAIPAFFICLAGAILYAFELIDRPLLSRVFERGVSQNVVARYVPGSKASARNRKIVLVANYDSGKVQSELNGSLFGMYPLLIKLSAIALIALPILWLLRILLPAGAALFFNVLTAVALVLALVPVAVFLMHKSATYNEAANNNASGVAAVLEVARLISEGSYSEEELAERENATIHGEVAAREAGVVPEGAELEYVAEEPQSEEERLASAKAAVAALTGKPIQEYRAEHIDFTPMAERDDIELYNESMDYGEYAYQESDEQSAIEENAEEFVSGSAEADKALVQPEAESLPEDSIQVQAEEVAFSGAAEENYAASVPSTVLTIPAAAPQTNEPSWYTTGRAKAVKVAGVDEKPVRRSRYADALDAALVSSKKHIDEAARMLDEGTIERISQVQQGIGTNTAAKVDTSASLQDIFAEAPEEQEKQGEEQPEQPEVTQAVQEEYSDLHETQAPQSGQYMQEAFTLEEDSDQETTVSALPDVSEQRTQVLETFTSETEEQDIEPAQTETSERVVGEIPEPESTIEEGESFEAQLGATTAMDPIDVSALRRPGVMRDEKEAKTKDTSKDSEEGAGDYDFTVVTSPSGRRYRSITLPSLGFEEEDPTSAPARHSNQQLQSEAIPRIETKPKREFESVFMLDESEEDLPEEEAGQMQDSDASLSEVVSAPETAERIVDKRAALRNVIPSLSGEFAPIVATDEKEGGNTEVSKTGSFATVGSESSIEPVGDELVANLDPEERYVEDADDSAYDENTTETGAFAGPGYVEMPESRISRFFNRFRSKPAEEETSASEWLDVDENFNPTEVGAARGGWESFRPKEESADESYPAAEPIDADDEDFDEYSEDFEDERSWNGGAFSQLRAKLSRDLKTQEEADELLAQASGDDDFDEYGEDFEDEEVIADKSPEILEEKAPRKRAKNEEPTETEEDTSEGPIEDTEAVPAPALEADANKDALESRGDELLSEESDYIAEETKLIYSFRNPDVNTEVWFVALGSEYAGNGGMKAFLAEHAEELRGSIIINLEAMGAGTLSYIEEEGRLLTSRPSSRMKRFLRRGTEATGVSTATDRIAWRESAASLAMKRGMQAMTLAGMEGGKPAMLGQGDDVAENIDESLVAENAQFILEVIKNI